MNLIVYPHQGLSILIQVLLNPLSEILIFCRNMGYDLYLMTTAKKINLLIYFEFLPFR